MGEVKELISAELPDPSVDFYLFKIVVENMIHGPCNENCLIDNQCKKKYQKRSIEQTVFVSNDFPLYRRRNFPSVEYMGENYNNSFVFPYNQGLCKIYNSHINVEICSSLGTIIYLNKYITKGSEAPNQPAVQGANKAGPIGILVSLPR
ncbi:hypothetical protein CDIK_3412 [Cucumispora dikerogammari]|nr:hypothetical protein CDIK_3412 [Cucumispora dikerogammari]